MNHFTPELCMRFNSEDDAVADAADGEWEEALAAYRAALAPLRAAMPEAVAELASLCLHDAEILGLNHASLLATVAARGKDRLRLVAYSLNGELRRADPPTDWPFPTGPKQWLYDEVDGRPGEWVHRVLFSDGSAVAIPFQGALVNEIRFRSDAA